jgi:DNA polymerase (family 10)
MGGKAHGGERVSREYATEIYKELLSQMPPVESVTLCGSARRLKPTCGDLDIVVVPSSDPTAAAALDTFFVKLFGYQKSGKPAKNGLYRSVQTEFYVASPQNVGTFVQMWTGSKEENIRLRNLAKKKGYSLSQYGCKNLLTNETVSFSKEEDLYNFLEVNFVNPFDR